MAKCETCGNDYDKAFQVTMGSRTMTFDSFECAIQAMAPECAACGCRIIGHGLEANGQFFCCDHCADEKGVKGLQDRLREMTAYRQPSLFARLTAAACSADAFVSWSDTSRYSIISSCSMSPQVSVRFAAGDGPTFATTTHLLRFMMNLA